MGDRLGDTLRSSGGPGLLDLVEEVRRLAKGARAGRPEDEAALHALLGELDTERAHAVARAFAHFLALANVAESRHRARSHEREQTSLVGILSRLVASGISAEQIHERALRQPIELVLTAHPTQATRRTVLAKYERIAEALAERAAAPEPEGSSVDERVRREIATLWHTEDLRRLRPTPIDEAKTTFSLFERVLWDSVPAFLREWSDALLTVTGKPLPLDAAPIRFGSWVGGDRDGNPYVTPDVTREACLLARWQAAELYERELCRLQDELSVGTASEELRALAPDSGEPYRKVLKGLIERVRDTRRACEEALGVASPTRSLRASAARLVTARELAEPLALLHRSLTSVGLDIVARGRLVDVMRRVATFGVTLAPLDIRQHADVHTRALDAVTRALDLGSYSTWSEDKRRRFLLDELASKRPLLPRRLPDDDALRDVIGAIAACAEQPEGSLGAYVISGCRDVSDVLAVHLLQREGGLEPPLRVVPLFETLADLESAPAVVDALLSIETVRRRVGGSMEIMIGYSDSAKDAGRVASAWALFVAQEKLLAVAERHGVTLTLFHGRGGTIGRGGGPITLSIWSQPPGSVRDGLRVTIQGEAIDAAFGLPEIAAQTFELYTTATLESSLRPPPAPPDRFREAMDAMAKRAASSYRRVLEDPRFFDYFQAATPERELGLLNIGSRPAKRSAHGGLGTLRAIPWIFAWTQNRLLLPSWLGAHEALEPRTDEDRAVLHDMMTEWPFFAALVDLLEMVVAKGDLTTASLYDRTLVPHELRSLGGELMALFERTRGAILTLRGQRALLESNPVLRFGVEVRNPYLHPLSLMQAELLRRLRAAGPEQAEPKLVDALLVTVHGVAAGMRNTG